LGVQQKNTMPIISRMPAMSESEHVCSYCGDAIGGRLFLRESEQHYCERCYLKRGKHIPHGEPYSLLAEALATALDLRERETGLHSKRVACHTLVLARRVVSDADMLKQIYWGALLHDIGKIGVPDAVLLKQGPLDESEWTEMRTHPSKGYEILAPVPGMAQAAELVLAHEERFDGSGYPLGLLGEAIPLGARLFAVIDTLDAITSDRPYRRAQNFDRAAEEIVSAAGSQFDPLAVEVFVAEKAALRRMVDLKCTMSEAEVDTTLNLDARTKP
jgi:HD-GYP domain-containing protein (c-di-GMP phosphodiesterase class II)